MLGGNLHDAHHRLSRLFLQLEALRELSLPKKGKELEFRELVNATNQLVQDLGNKVNGASENFHKLFKAYRDDG